MANVDRVIEQHESSDSNVDKDGRTFTRIYVVTGADNSFVAEVGDDGDDRIQLVGEPHPDAPILIVQKINAKPLSDAKKDVFIVTVSYATPDSEDDENPENPEEGDEVWVWNIASGTEHIIAVKEDKDVINFPANIANPTRLIGVQGVDEKPEGTNILVPTLSLSVKKYLNSGDVPANDGQPFIQDKLAFCKTVNAGAFHGWARGEVLFLGLGLRPFDADLTEVNYNFSIKSGSARIKRTSDPDIEKVLILPQGDTIPANQQPIDVPFEGHQIREFRVGEKLFPISRFAAFGSDKLSGILSAHVFTIYKHTDFAFLDLGA